jgi:hypothetical protein
LIRGGEEWKVRGLDDDKESGDFEADGWQIHDHPALTCSFDSDDLARLSGSARKWDMEAWMPGRGRWGEVSYNLTTISGHGLS